MCGIVGLWDFENKIEPSLVEAMRDTLEHRGPDDQGLHIDEEMNLGLGHQRLSILDLSPLGHQPMEHDGLWIVHNGEIYNFKSIRVELQSLGHPFKSESDTEVILKSYRQWGPEAVHRFRGMFAFCLWDSREKRLLLFRDRAGVKPLYYYHGGGRFMFASELKAILRHPGVPRDLDYDALALYFKYGYIPAPYSVFKNIRKLEAGHYLILTPEGGPRLERYWDVLSLYARAGASDPPVPPDGSGTRTGAISAEDEAAQRLETILLESFRLRLVSDVPVGVFLSSGMDSSIVTALLQKDATAPVKTFTIGFEDAERNEARQARRVAEHLGTDHHELTCTSRMAKDIVPRITDIYDEPFGDTSAIPTFMVASLARPLVKVALSADGGDESFAGYKHHQKLNRIHELSRRPVLGRLIATRAARPMLKLALRDKVTYVDLWAEQLGKLSRNQISWARFFYDSSRIWPEAKVNALLGRTTAVFDDFLEPFERPGTNYPDFLKFMMAADYRVYLPGDILTKVDRATMAVGLEGRDPLLDHHIIEYSSGLPSEYFLRRGRSKYLLRKILYKYLPRDYVDRPKRGFAVPLVRWLREDLKPMVLDYLNPDRIKRGGVLDWRVISPELDRFLGGQDALARRIWMVLEFELWRERWLTRS